MTAKDQAVAVDLAQRGKSNRRKGLDAERGVVKFLRANGFGGAERDVRTAYKVASRATVDPGDITGTPGICWQVKDCQVEKVASWLAETEAQRVGSHGTVPAADLGVLVVRRRGKSDPGRWWAWLPLGQVLGLDAGVRRSTSSVPVRLELGDLVTLLREAGYGDSLDDPPMPETEDGGSRCETRM